MKNIYSFIHPVLIETLWNVNESNGTWHKSPKVGINRNIVECKYR